MGHYGQLRIERPEKETGVDVPPQLQAKIRSFRYLIHHEFQHNGFLWFFPGLRIFRNQGKPAEVFHVRESCIEKARRAFIFKPCGVCFRLSGAGF